MVSRHVPGWLRRFWEKRIKPLLEWWEHLDGIRGFVQFVIPWLIAFHVWLLVAISALLLFAEVIAAQFGYGVHILRQDIVLYTAIGGVMTVVSLMAIQTRYRPPQLPEPRHFPDHSSSRQGEGTIVITEPIMPPTAATTGGYVATHRVYERDHVELYLDCSLYQPVTIPYMHGPVHCIVRAPDGQAYSTTAPPSSNVFSLMPEARRVALRFPDAFGREDAFPPGRYDVTWRQEDNLGTTISLLGHKSTTPLAKDSFLIR